MSLGKLLFPLLIERERVAGLLSTITCVNICHYNRRLNNGMILYLREVNSYLALVCLVRESNFKKGFIDYNIDCFKKSLSKVFLPTARSQQPIVE